MNSCIRKPATSQMHCVLSEILTRTASSSLSMQDQCRFALYGVGPRREQKPLCIHHIFTRHARAIPDALAASHLGTAMTYRQLDEASDRLALDLIRRGLTASRVCLLVQRSLHMLVGIFGILKSGASYIPLDGGVITDQTLNYVLKDSGTSLVLCTASFVHRVPEGLEGLPLEKFTSGDPDAHANDESLQRSEGSSCQDEAYVIYTSGQF